ncbi:hypothetical protein [Nocardia tenerifensis]|uniref:hypothetical protein n=1 Tax=Nocardia tenerifensis TaxID=228006 RepID=UPI0005941507|nr:hypothetical protein [Nocardia tenerifensis]
MSLVDTPEIILSLDPDKVCYSAARRRHTVPISTNTGEGLEEVAKLVKTLALWDLIGGKDPPGVMEVSCLGEDLVPMRRLLLLLVETDAMAAVISLRCGHSMD